MQTLLFFDVPCVILILTCIYLITLLQLEWVKEALRPSNAKKVLYGREKHRIRE